MPTEKAVRGAIKDLKSKGLYPTPHRIAKMLGCKVGDLPVLPTLTIEEVTRSAKKLKRPSVDGVSRLLGAPYEMVRRLYVEAGLPQHKRGRPETVDLAENELIRSWTGTDTDLAKELGRLKGRTYTKEAIRQKRGKLGIQLERQIWKNQALHELKNGVRPAVVAHKYRFALSTVENWILNDEVTNLPGS